MKKIISNLTALILNSGELKTIKGGYTGSCSTSCKDGSGNVLGSISTPDCNDTICECERAGYTSTQQTGCYC